MSCPGAALLAICSTSMLASCGRSPTLAPKGYVYFTDNREAARPLINYFYPFAGLPESRTRDQLWGRAFGFAWTCWTHGNRGIE